MAVKARQHFKRMRGGANAQLMLADDDQSYVVKFRNNPQHPRILVNELLAGVLLDYLGLPSCTWITCSRTSATRPHCSAVPGCT